AGAGVRRRAQAALRRRGRGASGTAGSGARESAGAGDPASARGAAGMRGWDAVRIAELTGAQLLRAPARTGTSAGPDGVGIDSRPTAPGELFVGLRGERSNGGRHAGEALAAGAWGVLVDAEHAPGALEAAHGAVVLAHPDPLAALQTVAKAWRRELAEGGGRVVAITGSTGKT